MAVHFHVDVPRVPSSQARRSGHCTRNSEQKGGWGVCPDSCAPWVVGEPFECPKSGWQWLVASSSFEWPPAPLRVESELPPNLSCHAAPAPGPRMSQLKNIAYRMPGSSTPVAFGSGRGPAPRRPRRIGAWRGRSKPRAPCGAGTSSWRSPTTFPGCHGSWRNGSSWAPQGADDFFEPHASRGANSMASGRQWPLTPLHRLNWNTFEHFRTLSSLLALDHMEPCVARVISSYMMVKRR